MRDTWAEELGLADLDRRDIGAAFALLSRIPVPIDHAFAGERGAAAAWAFPLVGAVLGLLVGIVAWVLAALGLPGAVVAALALGLAVMLTGGLHEDGLADCADGFGGGHTVARRLEIMKDSRVGAFGVQALVIAGLARFAGLDVLIDAGSLWIFGAVGAASRLPMVLLMFAMPLARPDGLAARVGLVRGTTAAVGAGVAVLLCLLFAGFGGLLILVAACLAAALLGVLAWQRIQGFTGDVLGGAQQVAEIAALAVAAALVSGAAA